MYLLLKYAFVEKNAFFMKKERKHLKHDVTFHPKILVLYMFVLFGIDIVWYDLVNSLKCAYI